MNVNTHVQWTTWNQFIDMWKIRKHYNTIRRISMHMYNGRHETNSLVCERSGSIITQLNEYQYTSHVQWTIWNQFISLWKIRKYYNTIKRISMHMYNGRYETNSLVCERSGSIITQLNEYQYTSHVQWTIWNQFISLWKIRKYYNTIIVIMLECLQVIIHV